MVGIFSYRFHQRWHKSSTTVFLNATLFAADRQYHLPYHFKNSEDQSMAVPAPFTVSTLSKDYVGSFTVVS
jgi:hypothetical protein